MERIVRTTNSLFEALACSRETEACEAAHQMSKYHPLVVYYVIKCYDTGKVYVDTNNAVRSFESLVCTYVNGIKTTYPVR